MDEMIAGSDFIVPGVIESRRFQMNKPNPLNKAAHLMACAIAIVALTLSVATASYAVENKRVKLAIEGMHCTGCAQGIKAMLKRTPGVITAAVSFEQREAIVEYDPERTTPEKIVEAIEKMGYKAKVKEEKEKKEK